MTYDDFVEQLKDHEGYRGYVYFDTEGIPTGGWGHAFLEGSKIPHNVARDLLYHDLVEVTKDYERLNLPIEDGSVREWVVKNMLFNLGLSRFLKFKKMLKAVREGDYERAAVEMLDSRWAKQVKGRAVELADMMRTGIYDPKK